MATRKEVTQQIVLKSGTAMAITVMDGLLIDDVLIQGAKAEGYRMITGRDVFPAVGKRVKDYLIKLGVFTG